MRLLDQVYASPSGTDLRFDFLRPESDAPLPLVVCLHGGGWISGDKSDMYEVVNLLVGNGFAAACISYRLAPLYPFPAAVQDVMCFVRYARANADELYIDPNRIASLGNSAGGHLAAMVGVLDRLPHEPEAPSARVQAVVDLCGISDITDPRDKHLPISWSFVDQFMERPFEGNEEHYRLASPITHVSPEAAKFLLIHGEDDDIVPISQSELFATALESHGVPVQFIRYPREGHAFSYRIWPDIADQAVAFLQSALQHKPVVKT